MNCPCVIATLISSQNRWPPCVQTCRCLPFRQYVESSDLAQSAIAVMGHTKSIANTAIYRAQQRMENDMAIASRQQPESLCPGVLSRRPCLLIASRFGHRKQLWALDKIENSQPDISGSAFGIATCPSQLCALALSFLALALQAILAQAKASLRARRYGRLIENHHPQK